MESQNHDEDEGSEVDDDGMAVDQEEDENERIRDFLRSENVDPFEKSDDEHDDDDDDVMQSPKRNDNNSDNGMDVEAAASPSKSVSIIEDLIECIDDSFISEPQEKSKKDQPKYNDPNCF